MSITKEIKVDQITVNASGVVLYREATSLVENGDIIAKTYHRTSLIPGQDLTGQPANVVAICNTAWTPEVIAAYQQAMAEAAQRMGAQA